jgi:pimeloyl-ACP methyl ester carboxylesterase
LFELGGRVGYWSVMKILFLALMAFMLPACANENLAHLAVDPPNHRIVPRPEFDPPPGALAAMGIREQFRVDAGDAKIYVRVADPAGKPLGTVIVLHGFLTSGDLMMNKARELTDAGYRAVVVDLRGHGKSSGDWITFGVRESEDLSAVADALMQRKLIAGKLGVLGMSYGAAAAIQFAGRDPRVRAVVAFAPFSSMRDVVPSFGRTFVPAIGWKSDEEYVRLVDAAGNLAGFSPDDASPLKAIQRTRAPVLLIHGTDDAIVPAAHSQRIYDVAKDHAKLVLLKHGGHASVWIDFDAAAKREMLAWLSAHLAN